MKFNLSSNSIRLIAAGTMGLFLSTGLITTAFAENKAVDTKKVDSAAVKTTDADFKKLDTNADGKISLKEAVKDKALASVFDVTDADHDGMLTTGEYVNYKSALSSINKETAPATN
ncbi:MAG TPA: EF-hand domain-containing protein [Methylotenera sp.]